MFRPKNASNRVCHSAAWTKVYQKLGDLVASGSLSAKVEQVYGLGEQKEALKQSLQSNRSGKVLFRFA